MIIAVFFMNDFLQNILKKHTSVCGKNIFLPPRFLNENPEDESPESGKKNKKEKEKKKDESRKVAEIDTKKIEKNIRGSVMAVIASTNNAFNARSVLDKENIVQKIIGAMAKRSEFQKINDILKGEAKNLDTKYKKYEKAMIEFGKLFGIPPSIQKTLMFEFEINQEIGGYMENFKKFIEKVIEKFIISYREFLEPKINKILDENTDIFKRKNSENEKQRKARTEKELSDKLKKEVISEGKESEIHDQLHKAIQKTIDPLVDKACDKFDISKDDLGIREIFKNGDLRTDLLIKYGEYKNEEWKIKLTKEQIGENTNNISLKDKLEELKSTQAEIKDDIEILKQKAKIDNAIKIYDFDNVDLGGENMNTRLTRNYNVISGSKKSIKSLNRKIEDAETQIAETTTKKEIDKKKEEKSKYEKEIKQEKNKIESFQQEINWVLDEYQADDLNKEEEERKELGQEIIAHTREQATNYLLGKGGWLDDAFYNEEAVFSIEDRDYIEKILKGKEKDYTSILSDRQILEYFHKQKKYENDNKIGIPPVLEFHNSIKDSAETLAHCRISNIFYDKFLQNNPSLDINNISSGQLREFIETMFDSSEGMVDPKDKKKLERLKEVKKILIQYLGGNPEKSNLKYYDSSEYDNLGKDDKNPNRPTIEQKGKEMLQKLLSSYSDKGKDKMQVAEEMGEVVEKDWNQGIYPCILKYDKGLQKLENENIKEENLEEKTDKKSYNPLKNLFGVGSLFDDWKTLNWYAVAEMFKTGFEGVRHYFDLKDKTKAAEVGYILADYIPFFGKRLKSEFLKQKQAKENEEVNSKKESYDQYGYSELIDELHKASDQFTVKAVLMTLAQKGYLVRNDLLTAKTIQILNKYLRTGMPIPQITPDEMSSSKKYQYIDWIRTGVDKEWGQGTLDGWLSESDSARESNIQKNFSLIQGKSAKEKMNMFNDLINLLLTKPKEFKEKYPIDIVLGYIRQEMVEGNVDCNIHLTLLTILRMEGVIDDYHVEEMRSKHANDYPSYAILKWDELQHSGMAKHYKNAKASGLMSGGKLQESHPFIQFFGNRHKLSVKAKKSGNHWQIAETAEEARTYEEVDIFASDLHQGRSAHFSCTDNSNIGVYARSYNVEKVIAGLPIDTGGNLPRDIKRQEDINAMFVGSFYTPIFADILAAQKAISEGNITNFKHQVQTTFYDLHSSYRMIEYFSQHKERNKPEADLNMGSVPKEEGGIMKEETESSVKGSTSLYFQNVLSSKPDRFTTPDVRQVTAKTSGINKAASGVCGSIDSMFALNHPRTGDRKMLGFKPWKHYWEAYHRLETFFQEIGGDMYDNDLAKKMIQAPSTENET